MMHGRNGNGMHIKMAFSSFSFHDGGGGWISSLDTKSSDIILLLMEFRWIGSGNWMWQRETSGSDPVLGGWKGVYMRDEQWWLMVL